MGKKNNYKSIYPYVKHIIETGNAPKGTLLPTEIELAAKFDVSRPTVAKVYSRLQDEGYVVKKKGMGTLVTYNLDTTNKYKFGLLLPGAGESEIFSLINNQILMMSDKMNFCCLWEGATANNAEVRKNFIDICCQKYIDERVDGIFFSPLELVHGSDNQNERICSKIVDADIPIILIDRDIVPIPEKSPFDVVGIDNYNAGMIMALHMIQAGCKNIYFFYKPYSAYSIEIRRRAIKDTLLEANIDFFDSNIFCGNPDDMNIVRNIPIIHGQTGIICANDATAAILMSSLDSLGYKCGWDYLLCGYDDMKYSQHLKCALTSFRQPCEEIANVSIDLMMRRIQSNDRPPVNVLLQGKLVARDSTKFTHP
jgi:GntR family transcriptional regulator of arabinose operon